jgi:hypothetical protein
MTSSLRIAGLAVFALALGACRGASSGDARTPLEVVRRASRTELEAFRSERELKAFLRDLARAQTRDHGRLAVAAGAKLSCVPETCESLGADCGVHSNGCGGTIDCGPCGGDDAPAAAAPAEAPAPEAPAEESSRASESITNVQHAGVDEGGIVKRSGDHLIVLRRGRLFSVDVSGNRLAPVSSIDAFGPDVDPAGSWYDELLVSDRSVVVIGFSYERGGTEIGLFDLAPSGKLSYRTTYHLRSDDYYSSRNYASRLIGQKLIFYAPLYLALGGRDLFASFPALRKWQRGAKPRDFERIVEASNVYRPIFASSPLTLHTVTVCDLGRSELGCDSTSVMGPPGRVFYVSPDAVYVWVTERGEGSLVYRLPLDGTTPSALRARGGSPVDQFSFLEGDDQHLNVVLRADASGDGMWSAEHTEGQVALLRVPLSSFSRHVERAPSSRYTALPMPQGSTFQNKFVGEHLLYGTGNGWGSPRDRFRGAVFAHRFTTGGETRRLALGHGVDRIEALGKDAVVIGSSGRDLHFSPVALGKRPRVAARYTRYGAAQGELRSHGFFYRSDGERHGLLGLPIREAGDPGYAHLFADSASVLFLKNRGLRLGELGKLSADPENAEDDGCRASCVDWYGNARPLFVGDRIFALLGYEIVEGEVRGGRMREKRRQSFAP